MQGLEERENHDLSEVASLAHLLGGLLVELPQLVQWYMHSFEGHPNGIFLIIRSATQVVS